ncbi:MAG: hypothetical protein JST40_10280 [Armatimonadetes bacterium]|nr:hypothetical protein [Armatimonadota bacterium]
MAWLVRWISPKLFVAVSSLIASGERLGAIVARLRAEISQRSSGAELELEWKRFTATLSELKALLKWS